MELDKERIHWRCILVRVLEAREFNQRAFFGLSTCQNPCGIILSWTNKLEILFCTIQKQSMHFWHGASKAYLVPFGCILQQRIISIIILDMVCALSNILSQRDAIRNQICCLRFNLTLIRTHLKITHSDLLECIYCSCECH
jgi:hypothetical protein